MPGWSHLPVEGAQCFAGREAQRRADVRHVQHLDGHVHAASSAQQAPTVHDAERAVAQLGAQLQVAARDQARRQQRWQRWVSLGGRRRRIPEQ
jgi:hypothetical protein